ncbi:MAG: hypothetical protein GSR84_01180 [Desulfurococcales archaeon]|nr:hypothetical protein [Desulfurococcales archaeon]
MSSNILLSAKQPDGTLIRNPSMLRPVSLSLLTEHRRKLATMVSPA